MNPRQKALKKNVNETIFYLCAGVVFLVVGFIAGISSIFGKLMETCALISFIVTVMWITARRANIKKCYCAKCGEKYDYESDIAWEVAEEYETENGIKDVVNFTCSCSHCGEEVSFSKTFKVAYVDKDGNVHKKNVSALASKYFKVG